MARKKTMLRRSFFFTRKQLSALSAEAANRGVAVAEVLRSVLESWLAPERATSRGGNP